MLIDPRTGKQYPRKKPLFRIRVRAKSNRDFYERVGFTILRKQRRLREYLERRGLIATPPPPSFNQHSEVRSWGRWDSNPRPPGFSPGILAWTPGPEPGILDHARPRPLSYFDCSEINPLYWMGASHACLESTSSPGMGSPERKDMRAPPPRLTKVKSLGLRPRSSIAVTESPPPIRVAARVFAKDM